MGHSTLQVTAASLSTPGCRRPRHRFSICFLPNSISHLSKPAFSSCPSSNDLPQSFPHHKGLGGSFRDMLLFLKPGHAGSAWLATLRRDSPEAGTLPWTHAVGPGLRAAVGEATPGPGVQAGLRGALPTQSQVSTRSPRTLQSRLSEKQLHAARTKDVNLHLVSFPREESESRRADLPASSQLLGAVGVAAGMGHTWLRLPRLSAPPFP